MKKNLSNAIGKIDEDLIEHANKRRCQKRFNKKICFGIIATAACLVIAVMSVLNGASQRVQGYAITTATYPTMSQYPSMDLMVTDESGELETTDYDSMYDAWSTDIQKQKEYAYDGFLNGMDKFLNQSLKEILSSDEEENKIYSPINVYIALSMLAETTDHNSRKQILDLLGVQSIEELRKQAFALWNVSYIDDGLSKNVLANSFWLNRDNKYEKSTLDLLAKQYYASSFSGVMGDEDYTKAFQDWINENTGNRLNDQVQNIRLKKDTILALVSTIYFKGQWAEKFQQEQTKEDVFHAYNQDLNCDFMHSSEQGTYYEGNQFTAIERGFKNYGKMLLILPNEGVDTKSLLQDNQLTSIVLNSNEFENKSRKLIHLSIPKFDISSDLDLIGNLKNMGISDVFDPSISDFTPLSKDSDEICVSEAKHCARVTIDEEGCVATAFTEIQMAEGALLVEDEVDFNLNRPFIFAIVNDSNVPLFIGTVNQPN